MFGRDQTIGKVVLALSTVAVLYYLAWVVALPFTDEDSSLSSFFPDPTLAIVTTALILVSLLTLTGVYIMHALIQYHFHERSCKSVGQ